MQLEYWTDEQVDALYNLYESTGDKEIASMFNVLFPKVKAWTLKHIEKKRLYLKLKRSKAQLQAIRERNRLKGCWQHNKSWTARKSGKIGTIEIWDNGSVQYPYYITASRAVPLHRYIWAAFHGSIEKGHIVKRINPDYPITFCNLTSFATKSEAAKHTATALSDNYVLGRMCHNSPELKKIIKQQLPELITLHKLILKNKQNA